jgi:hypothetical protein
MFDKNEEDLAITTFMRMNEKDKSVIFAADVFE